MNYSICVLALMSLALIGGASADGEETKVMLEKFCHFKRDGPKVTQASEVTAMATLLANNEDFKCHKKVREIIKRLAEVVEAPNVCSNEAVDLMVTFWKDFGKSSALHSKKLPKPLKKFFLAFGYQTSKLCKETLIQELEKATEGKNITPQDIKIVSEPMMDKVDRIFDDVRVENLMIIIQDMPEKNVKMTPIKMDPKRKGFYNLQREICVDKFEPVYDTLIKPIVRLSAIGISYYGSVAGPMADLEKSELYKNWFAAVLACEASSRVYPVEISKESLDSDGNEVLTFLDQDDIEELKETTGVDLDELEAQKPVDYKIEPVKVNDPVLSNEEYLNEAVRKHSNYLGTVTKFRMRMMQKVPTMIEILVEHQAVKFGLLPKDGKRKRKNRSKFGVEKSNKKSMAWLLIGGGVAVGIVAALALVTPGLAGGALLGYAIGLSIALVVVVLFTANFSFKYWLGV